MEIQADKRDSLCKRFRRILKILFCRGSDKEKKREDKKDTQRKKPRSKEEKKGLLDNQSTISSRSEDESDDHPHQQSYTDEPQRPNDSDTEIKVGSEEQSLNREQTNGMKSSPNIPGTKSKGQQQPEDAVDSHQNKKPTFPKESTFIVFEEEDRSDEQLSRKDQTDGGKLSQPVPATRAKSRLREENLSDSQHQKKAKLLHDSAPQVTTVHQEVIFANIHTEKEHDESFPTAEDNGIQHDDVIYENTKSLQKSNNISSKIPEEFISQTPESAKAPAVEASKSNCLKEFLQSIGLDSAKYCKSLFTDSIFTLEDLQQTINDEEKATKFDSKLRGIDRDCLHEAVRHEDILKQLQIIEYFPEGITLQRAMSKDTGKLNSLPDVPWYFLSKMLMIDYRCRDDLLPKFESEERIESEDTVDDIFAQFTEERNKSVGPHPTDILIAIFQCSSMLLRQVLCEKMFMCKLALPLLLPPFVDRTNKLLLWSLRNINIGHKISNGEFCENSLVNCPTSIVSCMRLGKPSISKSKFLNEILNGQTHNTFFHKDCSNGMIDREVSKGLLELAVCIPSAKKQNPRNQLNGVVTLVNLRGDGLHHKTSRDLLIKMSNIILVLVNISDLDEDLISCLKSITSTEKDLILILTKRSNTKFDEECKKIIRNCVKETESERFKSSNIVLGFTGSGEKNMKELLDELLTKISKLLDKESEKSVFKDLASSLHVKVDERTAVCSKGYLASQALLEKVKSFNIENARGELLPLQCHLWQEWARINKNEHRLLNKGSGTEGCRVKKRDIRREQRGRFEQPECFIRSFIYLMNEEDNNKQYIINWLKLFLNDISRKKIPALQEEYGQKWEEICLTDDITRVESLRNGLNELEVRIADASFGIEHLFREMGQVYEAYKESECQETGADLQYINSLPHLMVQLLLVGYPLEIMDGDASHVPVTWVKAVLRELANVIGTDKKLFALSVLGTQSSGKSTLLNTMFGLQFPVAAGRCTRGAYAQLVPMCKGESNTNYDYILVIDTEGLKAPELGKVKFNHDNEIATLVTGLGDVTLVNVKGENVSDMQDVLQIVVHAILKMRLVNKSLEMQPTCIFLHQNVSVPDAAQKMKKGQQNFMEILNKVTRSTGELENAPHISKLNQVIEFDIDKHIWYFSDLWEGDPPMAPANPGYSDKVQKLKKFLLTDIMQQRTHHLTIPELSLRVEDLWNGILHEDFVFSLKNNLEGRAYIALETKLLDITKDLKRGACEWVSNKLDMIKNREKDSKHLMEKLVNECEMYLAKELYDGKRKLETYFEISEDMEVIDQWRENIMSKLNESYEQILTEAKRTLKNEATKLIPLETSL